MSDASVGPRVELEHTHLASAGKTQLTLEDLAGLQPGVARLMLEVGNRFWRCYHAAKAHNRKLARFQMSEGTKLLRQCVIVRPKYDQDMATFIEQDLGRLRAVIEAEDWDRLDEVFAEMTSSVNRLHDVWDHGFLVWKVPEAPPADLVLEPPTED
ncbi:MAG: hypothetical protein JWM85_1492 [Acidimicrobiaceae bacterium]|nr:hypothetical protein [Acidimicrobiaceae bacterium]